MAITKGTKERDSKETILPRKAMASDLSSFSQNQHMFTLNCQSPSAGGGESHGRIDQQNVERQHFKVYCFQLTATWYLFGIIFQHKGSPD